MPQGDTNLQQRWQLLSPITQVYLRSWKLYTAHKGIPYRIVWARHISVSKVISCLTFDIFKAMAIGKKGGPSQRYRSHKKKLKLEETNSLLSKGCLSTDMTDTNFHMRLNVADSWSYFTPRKIRKMEAPQKVYSFISTSIIFYLHIYAFNSITKGTCWYLVLHWDIKIFHFHSFARLASLLHTKPTRNSPATCLGLCMIRVIMITEGLLDIKYN